jgi:4-diphosphocytidyl-2-C-methyl-D-erythritol kinase
MSLPSVTEFAPAKINLALHVLGRRADGYHELDSIVAFADVGDVLTIAPARETTLEISGPFAGRLRDEADNLVLRAHALLRERADVPPAAFHLEKNLPIASGIGGGSADAAAALRGLIRLYDIKLNAEALNAIALKLGADVPVCLHGRACRMQGVGERLSDWTAGGLAPAIVLVNPGKSTSTPEIFRALALKPGDAHGSAIESHAPWRNDLTAAAMAQVPEIGDIIRMLSDHPGVLAARMSGSGATCFGLAATREAAASVTQAIASRNDSWWITSGKLG